MFQFGSHPTLIRLIVVPALVFWMMGGGCAFGCQPTRPADTGSLASVRGSEACEVHIAEACCRRRDKANHFGLQSARNETDGSWRASDPVANGIKRCPLGIKSEAGNSNGRFSELAEVTVKPLMWPSNPGNQSLRAYDSFPVLNRGSTHLLGCVFLI